MSKIVNFFTKLATSGSDLLRQCGSTDLAGGPAALQNGADKPDYPSL